MDMSIWNKLPKTIVGRWEGIDWLRSDLFMIISPVTSNGDNGTLLQEQRGSTHFFLNFKNVDKLQN